MHFIKLPGVDEIDELDVKLSELTPYYEDVILVGDFNENQLFSSIGQCPDCVRVKCSKCKFYELLCKFSLFSVGKGPTHFPVGYNSSQIDFFITNNLHNVEFFNQISTGLSSHDLLAMSYRCDIQILKEKDRFTRRIDRIKVDDLMQDACRCPWEAIYNTTDI